ncbi:MAG: TonB-dependent receptor [Proteobacteria bacterium]|nr:TonB-dependent receptor [Pseudomonadota bacterium]
MMTINFGRSAMAAAVWSVVCAVPVHAALQNEPSVDPLEEIIVTASRNKQRVFDSPVSLSVINREELDRSTVPTLAEMMRDVPGVQVTDSGQPGLSRVRMRGEESRRTAILINSQEVTDHHEVGTPLTLHPAMVERIEIIRGSGAVLYGSRALSGVVNFFTRKGGSEPLQATLSGGYDSATSGYNTFASVFGNVEGFEYRVAWSKSDYEERATPEGEMPSTAFENESLYLYAGKTFGSHHLEYTYENYESSNGIFVEEEVKTTFPLTDFYLDTPQRDREKHGAFYSWELDNSWLQSVEANAYRQVSDRHFYSLVKTVWYERDINTLGELITDGALAQLNFQPLGNHTVIAGVQYLNDEIDQTRHVDTFSWVPPVATSGLEIIKDKASIETWAWFVQDQWQLNDRLALTAGMRQYFVQGDLEYTDRESLDAGSLNDDDEVIGSLGLVWEQSDDIRLRASVSQGYVYPSLLQLATGAYAGSSFANPDPNLTPETSVNYEVGMRLQRGGLIMDATAFYTESEDYIHHQPCAAEDNCPGRRDRIYLNIGESQAHGVELYLAYANAPWGVQPYANLTWMERRNQFDELSTWDTGIPALSGRIGLRWQGSLSAIPALWTDFYLRGESGSDVEEPDSIRNELDEKDSWVTVNVATGIDFGRERQYQLALELVNLTDKSYIASTENLYGVERSIAAKFTANW